jgi:polysaccharide biosynthesis protein PslG
MDVPPGYTQQQVPTSQPCAAGAIRRTGLRQIALTAQAGADADRLGWTWGSVEPRPPGQPLPPGVPRFNWEPLIERYRAMLQAGIRPVVLAWGTPEWARSPGWDRPGACSAPGGAGCVFPPAPSHLGQWRAYVRGLMVHLPDMLALEIWNEPNSARFFAPHPSPGLYARMLRAADQAARHVGFDRPIITGGLAPEKPRHAGKVPPVRFLSRVYELAGRRAFDGIGTHPYPAGPPWVANMNANLNQLRAVARSFHDAGKPLWITEVGLGGTPGGAGLFGAPLDRQGPILASMYRSVQGTDVRAFLIYNLYDSPAGGNRFGPYGVLTPALRPKPAYCYLAQHLGGRHACAAGTP